MEILFRDELDFPIRIAYTELICPTAADTFRVYEEVLKVMSRWVQCTRHWRWRRCVTNKNWFCCCVRAGATYRGSYNKYTVRKSGLHFGVAFGFIAHTHTHIDKHWMGTYLERNGAHWMLACTNIGGWSGVLDDCMTNSNYFRVPFAQLADQ